MSDTLQLSPRTTATAVPERPPRPRESWADVAKGTCILLVVLWHVITKNYLQVDWRLPVPLPGAWGLLGEQLLPLRMPLFFAISGMFAVGAVGRSWRVLGRSKVAKFGYLYAVWLLIHTLVLALVPDFDTARATGPLQLLEELTITPTNLWYLLALAVYFTVAKAVRRLPTAVVLGVALALSVAVAADLLQTPGNRGGLYQNLVFFLAGVRLRPLVEGLARAANWRRLALLGAGYALGLIGLRLVPATGPLVSVVAVAFGVTGAALAARSAAVARVLSGIGRRTLPIYVLHMPVLAICHAVLIGPMDRADQPMQLLLAVIEPVLLTVMVTWFCLALERSLPAALVDLPRRRSRPADLAGAAASRALGIPGTDPAGTPGAGTAGTPGAGPAGTSGAGMPGPDAAAGTAASSTAETASQAVLAGRAWKPGAVAVGTVAVGTAAVGTAAVGTAAVPRARPAGGA
jgi:uncharacterized membrane protein YcfT